MESVYELALFFTILILKISLAIAALFSLLFLVRHCFKKKTKRRYPHLWKKSDCSNLDPVVVAFFHPYCNAGGGGERVLWCGIRALQQRYEFVECVVYTGDTEATSEDIVKRAKERFNIELKKPVQFIYLSKRRWVEAGQWPHFTLLGQSIGSIFLGFEALFKFLPDVYIDTMGYSFTYPLFRFLGGCSIGCYVHYPTISTDMLSKVRSREHSYNNLGAISNSAVLTYLKLAYYKIFALLYCVVGKCASVIMVNSTWTQNHIIQIWNKPSATSVVYPPCNTTEFSKLGNCSEINSIKKILSIGQFRPEKNHALQIKSFARFLKKKKSSTRHKFVLSLVGSCRNEEDSDRVDDLMLLCEELCVLDNVEFHLNIPYAELKEQLSQSTIGIHTMWNEHFGIGIVEFMAAGVIPLAHDSGGPKLDIVKKWNKQGTGFLASNKEEYARKIQNIFDMKKGEREKIRDAAMESVQQKFSDEIFEDNFLLQTESLIRLR